MDILVVEDSPSLRESYLILLESEGHKVKCAEDGREGYIAALAEPFDLILTDHDMPNMTGSEMATKLREATLTTPIILCTGNRQARCPEANAIIHKPFDIDDLITQIGRYV